MLFICVGPYFFLFLGIVTESCESLKDLELMTLKILSAASGNRYLPAKILAKISFVMTDSTSHNMEVIEMVCEDLEIESVPKTLLCNAHPLMLFQSKIVEVSIL